MLRNAQLLLTEPGTEYGDLCHRIRQMLLAMFEMEMPIALHDETITRNAAIWRQIFS
jgi:hypothetical protein